MNLPHSKPSGMTSNSCPESSGLTIRGVLGLVVFLDSGDESAEVIVFNYK